MIEIKGGELSAAYLAISSLLSCQLPIEQAYRIARINRELENELKLYETARMAVIEKYCDKDENGNPITDENGNINISRKSKNYAPALAEINKLESESISINVEPISLEEFEDIKFTPEQIMNLMMFIKKRDPSQE